MTERSRLIRLRAVLLVPTVLLALGIVARLYYLQVIRYEYYRKKADSQHHTVVKYMPCRGKILDRNLRELATGVLTKSLYVDPSGIHPSVRADLAHDLATALNTDFDTVFQRLSGKSPAPLMRKIEDDAIFQAIAAVREKYRKRMVEPKTPAIQPNAFYFVEETKRIYPRRDLASHVIGYTELDNTGDNKGLAGVERTYDEQLRGKIGVDRVFRNALGANSVMEPVDPEVLESTYGNTVVLTIDEVIQRAAEASLRKYVNMFSADAGVAVVYDVKTGEVLAMANCPTFDLTNVAAATDFTRRNRAITDAIEPGSVMKIFTYASVIEEERIRSLEEMVDCEGGRWTVAGRTVVDSHAIGTVPIRIAFAQSSNVAAAKLAMGRLTPAKFYRHLVSFGFGEKTGIDLPGEATGRLRPLKQWTAQSVASLAYGYELQVTAIQVVAAAAAIMNNGIYMQPHIVREIRNYRGEIISQVLPQKLRRVCSPATTEKMKQLMEAVVREGTGKAAQLAEYRVGGKTGTTIKIDPKTGKYSRGNYIGSFCGVAPLEDPRICIYVWIDNPRGGTYYGGQVAAPVFKEIAEVALKQLKVPVSVPQEETSEDLNVVFDRVRSQYDVQTVAAESERNPLATLLEQTRRNDQVATGSMPDLRGLTMREVHEKLASFDHPVEYRGSGVVVDQSPRPYETIEPGDIVVVEFGSQEEYLRRLAELPESQSAAAGSSPATSLTTAPAVAATLRIARHGKEVPLQVVARVTPSVTATAEQVGAPTSNALVEDPDPRVRSGPAPDVGKSVWAKTLKQSFEASDDLSAAMDDSTFGEETPSPPPTSRPDTLERSVRSAYDLQQVQQESPTGGTD